MLTSYYYQNEGKAKAKRRQLMMTTCLHLVNEVGIRHITVEKLMQELLFDHRTFYNYYDTMKTLLEDIMIDAMRHVYDFSHYQFSNTMTIHDFFNALGKQFINHCMTSKLFVNFIDDYDHYFNKSYPSKEYELIIKEIYQYPFIAFHQSKTIHQIVSRYDPKTVFENIQLYISSLFVYLSRLVSREKIYENHFTFLSSEGLEQLREALSLAISESLTESINKQ